MEESDSDTSDTEYFSAESDTESDTYECDPGLCVIINNTVFNTPQLGELKGGKKDEEDLKKLFKKLGFTVMVHKNLTAEKMKSTAEGYSHMKHSGVFFLIILSHGGEGDVVYGTDGKKVEVHQLKKLFYATDCPSLAGIPKVFVIDACRGSRNEGAHHFMTKHTNPSPNRRGSVTDSADVYTIFASTRGTTAGIDSELGSHLTRNFVDIVTKATYEKNFEEIMIKVKRRIQSIKTQTAETTSTLTKDYYIKRYQVDHEASEDSQQQQELQRYQALQERLVHHWLLVREKTIREVTKTATELENHHNVMSRIISFVVFKFISIFGPVIIIVSLLIPFRLIVSFVMGSIVSILQQAILLGPSIVDKIIKNEKEIRKQLDEDSLQIEVIQQMAKDIQVANTNMQVDTAAPVIAAIQVGNIEMTVGEINIVASRIQEIFGISYKEAAPFAQIIYIIAKGFPTNVSERLNELAEKLKDQMRSIEKEANIK